MLYLRARSFNHHLQLLVKLSVKEVYLFYIFLTTNITHWNFIMVFASIINMKTVNFKLQKQKQLSTENKYIKLPLWIHLNNVIQLKNYTQQQCKKKVVQYTTEHSEYIQGLMGRWNLKLFQFAGDTIRPFFRTCF
jgi:hypothetical protein